MKVEVVYAEPDRQLVHALSLVDGATVADALAAIARHEPFANLSTDTVGVWGEACGPERVLRDGDRLEIYRPLTVDPKEARRRRALEQNRKRQADQSP